MSDKEIEQNEFRLTSPDDSNNLDRRHDQSCGGWESKFRVPSSTDKDQLRLWFENAATHANREFIRSFNEIRKAEEPKQEARNLVATIGALLMIGWLFRATNRTNSECRPPFNAEYILYLFLRREERDEVIGDLIESYGQVVRRFGKRRADVWFCKQVAGSLLPLLRQSLLRLGAFVWLGRILRRLIS